MTLETPRGVARFARAAACLVLFSFCTPRIAATQEVSASGVHWAFGSFLGTGVYRVSSERNALVIEIPIRWTASHAKIGAAGERRIGLELRLPVTPGVLQGDRLGDFVDQDVYGTVTVTPGIEAEVPLTPGWSVRPYVFLGWGSELGPEREPDLSDPENPVIFENEEALIYQNGIKSRWSLPFEIGNSGLLGAVRYAGYNPDTGPSADLLSVTGGLETRQRLGSAMRGPHALFVEAHATYSYVTDLARLRNGTNPPIGVDDYMELGLAVSQGVVPFRFWRIPIERLGLAVQLNRNGGFQALKLSFRSPFRR